MLLGILGTQGAHEQAWPFPLEPPFCEPAIPNKPKDSGVHPRGDDTLQSNHVPMHTRRSLARNGAQAPRNIMPPSGFVPDAGNRARCNLSLETLQGSTLEQLLNLLYGLVITLLKRKANDL